MCLRTCLRPLGLEDHMIKSSLLLLPPGLQTKAGRCHGYPKEVSRTQRGQPHNPGHLSLCGLLGPIMALCGCSHTQPAGRHASQFWLLISQAHFSFPSVSPLHIHQQFPLILQPKRPLELHTFRGSNVPHLGWPSLPSPSGL